MPRKKPKRERIYYAGEPRDEPLGVIPRRAPGPQIFAAAAPERHREEPDPLAALDPVQRAAVLEFVKHYIANYHGPYAHLNARRSS